VPWGILAAGETITSMSLRKSSWAKRSGQPMEVKAGRLLRTGSG
jgi:hypothetical protein